MLRFLPGTIAIVTAISPLFVNQMDAYCARCMKIEEERAKEQAAHPQPFHYYDDLVSLHEKDSSEKESSDSNQSEDSTQTGTGALSGSTYRTTEVQKSSKSSDAKTSRLQSLLANVPHPVDANFFEENTIPDSKEKDKDSNKETPEHSEGNIQSQPVHPSVSRAYSAIYTVFKTKNFLEALDGAFTLFIPTNQAIQAFPPEKVIRLALPENAEKLAALVSNHVIARKILRNDFVDNSNQEVKAISGRNLTLSYKDGNLYVENIKILRAEPAGFDGVIYIIEKVIGE
jgi:uncharacterized surface protein with fasciclin (FAS1) repeats